MLKKSGRVRSCPSYTPLGTTLDSDDSGPTSATSRPPSDSSSSTVHLWNSDRKPLRIALAILPERLLHVSRLSHLPLIPVVRSVPRRPPDHLLDQPSHLRRPVGRSRRSGLESSSGSCGRLDHGSQGTKLLVGMDEEREFRRTLVLASQAFEATRGASIELLQMESRRMQMASKAGDR